MTAPGGQLAQDITGEIRAARPDRPPTPFPVVPELGLQHAVAAVRTGGRVVRWASGFSRLRPGVCAAACWMGWAWLTQVARSPAVAAAATAERLVLDPAGNPVLDAAGKPVWQVVQTGTLTGTAGIAATWFGFGAAIFTIGAVTLAASNALAQPTHRVGHDGRLRAVAGYTTRSARRHGSYTRIRRGRGVRGDWKQAGRDVAHLDRRLARVGQWRLRRWGRQWARERAAGVPDDGLTRPGVIDRALFRRVKPPAQARRWARQHRKTERNRKRQERAEAKRQRLADETEWAVEVARIEGAQHARTRPGPRLDPADGPPTAPDRTEDPTIAGYRARSDEVATSTNRFLAEIGAAHQVGYEPPPAPTNGSKP